MDKPNPRFLNLMVRCRLNRDFTSQKHSPWCFKTVDEISSGEQNLYQQWTGLNVDKSDKLHAIFRLTNDKLDDKVDPIAK
jgi:hypothetical protein